MASGIQAVRKKVMHAVAGDPSQGTFLKVDFSHSAIYFKMYMFSCYI